ncbi:hypothetical protein HIM_08315 [Hirsutella minnesotensis 3608]|uniref:AB hydrolase-1 domain-containing protein n=1 Tax=Hirsutella minnesotensis 3608 TaxID=1043627 RepID=A0A0F8A3R2_9HYPO|nr:hypothetical protein HIM_08315 [Hirsutella minnesotensis 3608]
MDTSKLVPNDPRVKHTSATIRGKTYSYIIGEPRTKTPVGTVVLIHGFPDLGFGWRCQVPYLMSLGFRVVVPDMLGYAGTSRPNDLQQFSFRNIADDIKALARTAPRKDFIPLEKAIAAGHLTNFRYQLQLRGPDIEEKIQGPHKIRQFLSAVHDAVGTGRETGFTVERGVIFEDLDKLTESDKLSKEELDYYVQQYILQDAPQMRGPLNWYRTREINYKDELPLAQKNNTLEMPTLFIAAKNDTALPPSMSVGMEQYLPKLTRGEVESSHWAPTEASADVNRELGL